MFIAPLCFPLFVLWLIGTIVHKVQWSGARMQARALFDEAQAIAKNRSTVTVIRFRPGAPGTDDYTSNN